MDHSVIANCIKEILNITDNNVDEVDVIDIVNNDKNHVEEETTLCPILCAEIFENFGILETETRPCLVKVHPERARCVEWLAHLAHDYRFVHDPAQEALHLAVNYLDRYLSGNQVTMVSSKDLYLIGMTCLMIAIKYEQEICVPRLDNYVFLAEGIFSAQEFIQMEYSVLSYLDFGLTTPTAWCFIARYLSVIARHDQGGDYGSFDDLECVARFITWLSLFSDSVQCYLPSTIAASAVFLARYILVPTKTPWNGTLAHYTEYQPSDLRECVFDLYELCLMCRNSSLPSIKTKYNRLINICGCVAFEKCPPSIPHEYFEDPSFWILLLSAGKRIY
ncbi:hypothetical protein RD792_009486 [Penstemon davidsonii]|uniref:Cyclin N-terminal domain-containing protein n=1 Tax=Penstemon davidsonii TaxID=160366 RepID=A0ABR0D164_9LAMI|nr:hypothetical protein RD792_009486 [Penstemon davidsonii]